jgi:RNA polymerase sigma factor (sigma-70 family)
VSPERPDEMSASGPGKQSDEKDRFRSMFELRYPAIHSYVLRRLGPSSNDVVDVTAQVFAVAWRRRRDIPKSPEDLPWLYGVARRIVSRHRRGAQRRQRLEDRLVNEAGIQGDTETSPDPEVLRVRAAISRLRAKDQELLKLVLWEELTHAQVWVVLGCSTNAVALRLHKARSRLESELEKAAPRPEGPSVKEDGAQEGSS